MLEDVRTPLSRQLTASGYEPELVERARHGLDPNVLTTGFARRLATYKRLNLLLHDPDQFVHLLNNSRRPVQLTIAGKIHPTDGAGQEPLQQWIQFTKRYHLLQHAVFMNDYDMRLTESLVRVNGGLNLSELNGRWAEAYNPAVGWALGDGREHGDDPASDTHEVYQFYNLLERHVIPEFYVRDANRVFTAWVARMRASMARPTPQLCTNRTVHEYMQNYYLPAAKCYRARAADRGAGGVEIVI